MTTRTAAGVLLALTLATSAFSGDIRTVALTGDPAPGGAPGAVFEFLQLIGLNNKGQVAIIGDDTDGHGIWSESSGVLDVVAHVGGPAPLANGEGTFALKFFDPNYGDAGTSFLSLADTGDGSSRVGIWSKRNGLLEPVTFLGDLAPGTADEAFRVFAHLSYGFPLNDAGRIAFVGHLDGPDLDSLNNHGIWSDGSGQLQLVARQRQAVPGAEEGVTFDVSTFRTQPPLNNVGDVAISGILVGPGIDETNNSGIWLYRDGALELVARSGDQVPGMEPGVRFGGLYGSVINDAGDMAFFGAMIGVDGTTSGGIWSNSTGDFKLAFRFGDETPGVPGAHFRTMIIGKHVLNGTGQIAFQASALDVDGEPFSGIWSEGSGVLDLVARTGVAAPGTEDGVVFLSFDQVAGVSSRYGVPHLNGAGQAAFAAKLAGPGVFNGSNEYGIWAESVDGELKLIVRTGDEIEVAPGDFRTVERFDFIDGSGNEDGRNSFFNERGQLAFQADFTDGSRGIFVSNAVAIPEPGSLVFGVIGLVLVVTRIRCRRRV